MFRRHNWQRADASIITKSETGCVVEVRPADGLGFPFQATIAGGGVTPVAGPGAVIGVLYDPDSHEAKFDESDPRLKSAGQAAAPPGPPPAGPAHQPPPTPAVTTISGSSPQATFSFSSGTTIPGFGNLGELISEAQTDPQAFKAKMRAQVEQLRAQAGQTGAQVQPGQPIVITTSTSNAATPPGSEASVVDRLTKLADLHDQGAITQEEFDAMKKKLLAD